MMYLNSRSAAKAEGEPQYVGRPCKHGHDGLRYTTNGDCVECTAHRTALWQKSNPDRYRARALAACRAWRERNPELDKIRGKTYRKKCAHLTTIRVRRRRTRLRTSMFEHESAQIRQIYLSCPEGHQVDHIIPLVHPLVCGLHSVSNLQYLTAIENQKKGNRWEPNW